MGYDMDILFKDGVEDNTDDGYFRLNIWGMGKCRQAMDQFGMVDWNTNYSWPKLADYGLKKYPDEDESYPEDSPEARFILALTSVKSQVPDSGLIAGYKLGSNDGWIITPKEIEGALAALGDKHDVNIDADPASVLRLLAAEGVPEFFGDWIQYLQRAAKHNGFKVW
jgi:hypothetical protein